MNNNQDDPNKLYGLEQTISYLSKNMNKNINPIPDYSIGKPDLPAYSFPKGERFFSDRKNEFRTTDYYSTSTLPNEDRKLPNLGYLLFL
jgi:hypothetical protein